MMAVPGPSLNERLIKMLERLHQNESCPNLSLEGLLDTATQHLQTSEATHEDLKRALDDYGRLLVSLEDFDHISKIGSGKFGSTIHLVREKLSSRLHALKSLPRSRIEFQKGGVGLDHVCTERTILASANNQVQQEWIPKLRFAFQCQESLHMVMDYFPGGDLKTLLRRQQKFSDASIRFYSAECVLALHYLHKIGFAHLDLQPENVLLDRFGHIRLADFGAAVKMDKGGIIEKQINVQGAIEYVAPEVLEWEKKGQESPCFDGGKADFWSLGIMAFEMSTGKIPKGKKFDILTSEDTTHFDTEFRSLLTGLLQFDSAKRLGYQELVRHTYFISIDWDQLSTSCPPYIPEFDSDLDLSHFEPDRNPAPLERTSLRKSPNKKRSPQNPEYIIGFSYVGQHPEPLGHHRQFPGDDIISSLRRQNDDLRSKLMKLERRSKARESLKSNGNRTRESGESSQLQVLCDQESKELRTTISRLEKLLQLERQEHDANEKKTLQLLTDVKTKWQDREEARVLKVQKEKEDAEKMSEEWKTKASKLEEQLLAEKKELEKVLDVKGCLKAKLKECKGKLESTIVKYESEVKRCKEIELGTTAVHEDSEAENKRLKMNLDNADNKLLAMQKSMDVIRGELEVEKAATKKVKEQAKDSKEQLEEEIKKLRSKNKKLEEENTRVREDLDSLEKENDASKSKMKLKEAKLNDLEGILQNLENKIKPGQGNENSNKPACICETLKSDMGLQKVELRLMEKKNKDLEGRVKFLREVMIKEERDAKDKLADELKVTKEKLAEIEGKADQIEEANKFNEVMKEKLRLMESNLEELRSVRDQSQEYKTQLDFALKKLERAKDTAEDASRTKVNYETMKHTCLELQDQVTEYETLVSKLEKAAVLNKESQEKMTKEIDTLSETVSKLRVEKNEIKSSLIYAETQLKEVKAKHEDVEMLYKREEETWNTRYNQATAAKQEQSSAMLSLNNQLDTMTANYDLARKEANALKEENMKLKEEGSLMVTNIHSIKDSNLKLHEDKEELYEKISAKNNELRVLRERLAQASTDNDKKEHEASVQIKQLKKLVDHLQSKVDSQSASHGFSKTTKKQIMSNKLAMSYEEVTSQLEREKLKVRQMQEELLKRKKSSASANNENVGAPESNKASAAAKPLKEKAAKDLASKNPVAETGHAIPHRFQKQTTMKVQKCSVCFGHILFCSSMCVCKFCHRVVHPSCEVNVGQDCGLSSGLALMLKTNASNSQGVLHKGYLKVPDAATNGRTWKTVGVQIVKDRLIVDGGKKIKLNPDSGFVYIQSTVAYNELLHTSAYDQPHIFKIGYSSESNMKDAYYFMAKTFQEKGAWIDAIEKVTLTLANDPLPVQSPSKILSPSKALGKWNPLTSFPHCPEIHLYCALEMTGNDVIFGTSSGIYRTSGCGDDATWLPSTGEESVFQMALVEDMNEVVGIVGPERHLVVMKEDDLERAFRDPRSKLKMQNVDCIKSCHLFGVGYFNGSVFICVIDDCTVSLLVRDPRTERYELGYAFTTDQPTTCIHFTQSSVLVITNTVYEIQLSNFVVSEFLHGDLVKQISRDCSYLVGLYQLSEEEFIICFQDYGMFVNRFGERSRNDLRWSSMSGQFFVSDNGRQLWMTYYNAVEALDLDSQKQIEMIQVKNPQILATNEKRILFVDKRSPENLIVMSRR